MKMKHALFALLGLALAAVLTPVPELQAASPFGPNTQLGTESLTYMAKAKAKAKMKAKAKAKAKRGKRRMARSKAGRCGAGMYWSRSKRSCQSAAMGPVKR
jgi:hypothetical protein